MSAMRAIVIYESLTGNTKAAATLVGDGLRTSGVVVTVCSVTAVDYQALAEADVVVVGTWTDGYVFAGQRPGRQGRIAKLPSMAGKKAAVFCTYAVNPGKVLEKMARLLDARGADVIGGFAIKRTDIAGGADTLVDRLLANVADRAASGSPAVDVGVAD